METLQLDYLYFEDLNLDFKWRSESRTITEADIVNFAGISGDFNRIHMDEHFASQTPFKGRIAHGLLGLSVASGLQSSIANIAIEAFTGLQWKFSKPIYIGDSIHQVSKINKLKDLGKRGSGILKLERDLINQKGVCVQRGEWTLLVAKRHK